MLKQLPQWFSLHPKWILAAFLFLYLPFCFLGFGSDWDTYSVVDTGRKFLEDGHYQPSRHPGYPVHEIPTAILIKLGGSLPANLGTLLMSLMGLVFFWKICEHFGIKNKSALTLILALHPVYWVNSTCTIDYVWALALFLAGFWMFSQNKQLAGVILMGLCMGTRLSMFVAVIAVAAFLWTTQKQARRNMVSPLFLMVVFTGACYLPSFAYANWTLDFLKPNAVPAGFLTPAMCLGKFAYKTIYFFGLPAALLLICLLAAALKDRIWKKINGNRSLSLLCISTVVGYLFLFLKYPFENEYLLPALPFLLIFLGLQLKDRPQWLAVLGVLIFSFNFMSINVARPDQPNQAANVRIGLWVEPGYLIQDCKARLKLRHCQSLECWKKVMEYESFAPSLR